METFELTISLQHRLMELKITICCGLKRDPESEQSLGTLRRQAISDLNEQQCVFARFDLTAFYDLRRFECMQRGTIPLLLPL